MVQLRRQEELTCRIQAKRVKAGNRSKAKVVEIQSNNTDRMNKPELRPTASS